MWLLLLTACRALTVADVTTGESEAYPELRSIHQPIPARLLFRQLQQAIKEFYHLLERVVCSVLLILGNAHPHQRE